MTGDPVTIEGFDRFREIGRGGSAVVYEAHQAQLDRLVAIKVLHVDLADDVARRRFDRECAVLGSLSGVPGVVAVYSSAFTADGRGCIVMRLMRESLAATVQRDGPLPVATVLDVGVAIAAGLDHAHRAGIVHRDVKPANLLVSDHGDVAIGDFDIASAAGPALSTATQDSMSPPHAPPERLTGESVGDVAGDVWSLGSTLWTLLEGRPPFGAASDDGGMAGLIDRVRHHPVPALTRWDVPPDLEDVLVRALAKDPADRWPDAAAMGAALAAARVEGSGVDPDEPPAGRGPDDRTMTAEPTTRSVVGSAPAGSSPVIDERPWWTTVIVVVAVIVALAVAVVLAVR